VEVSRVKELEREVKELKRANEILLAASSFFARELCASLIRGTPGRVASGPDKCGTCWHCQTARVR
jgi:transposase-like protein